MLYFPYSITLWEAEAGAMTGFLHWIRDSTVRCGIVPNQAWKFSLSTTARIRQFWNFCDLTPRRRFAYHSNISAFSSSKKGRDVRLLAHSRWSSQLEYFLSVQLMYKKRSVKIAESISSSSPSSFLISKLLTSTVQFENSALLLHLAK